MAVYKFRLQKLLDYKESLEQEKKNQLSIAVKRLEEEKNKILELKSMLKSMDSKFHQKTSEGLSVNKLKILANYIDYYKRRIKEQKIKIKMAEDYVSICREELIKASREKKMIEKLKDKNYNKFLYNEQKNEEKLVDDLVSYKESSNS